MTFLFALALTLAPAGSPAVLAAAAQTGFDAAVAREARGDYQGAESALETIGHADGPFAGDALFEAAVLAEQHLSDPAHAARLYRELSRRFPSSRLERRATARADFLERSLVSGAAPLAEYQRILAEAAHRPRSQSIAEMERLLVAHPDFALRAAALDWLGNSYAKAGRTAEAMDRFARAERARPGSAAAARAERARADLLLGAGHPFIARALYRELAQATDPVTRATGLEGLVLMRSAVERWIGMALAALYLAGYLWAHRRALRPQAPVELWYYAPVALLFVLAGATENAAIGKATFGIALGGALVVWMTGNQAAAHPDLSPGRRALRAAAAGVAVIAVVYLAVQLMGLGPLIAETWRTGPERS